MIAETISIGAELTTGMIVDTNSSWLSSHLWEAGVPVRLHTTVGDERGAIADSIRSASKRCDLLLITGGLGPTLDDLTRQALADVMGVELELDEPSLREVAAYFDQLKRAMPSINESQAMFPRGSRPLSNKCGTAPGIRAEVDDCITFAFPGVPREMTAMFEHYVIPEIAARQDVEATAFGALHTFGLGESRVAERIGELMRRGRNPSVGTTASDAITSVRIVARAETAETAESLLQLDVDQIEAAIGEAVFGRDDDTLASVVGELLGQRSQTVATAESCTGGLIAKLLTDVSGSSSYFRGGFVTYSNELKESLLGVAGSLLEAKGAVSAEVAEGMAEACRRRAGSDYGISTTGIAGPTGGTNTKPVGLVYIGIAGPEGVDVSEYCFDSEYDRQTIRGRAANTAMNSLRTRLLGEGSSA